MRVLLIEDDQYLRSAVTLALSYRGYAVDQTDNGGDGLAAALTQAYDVILLDLGLPGLSGIDVVRNLRAKQVKTPVIIVTACDTHEDKVQGLASGADDYVVKPFDFHDLEARIKCVNEKISK